ncbi:MAG: histidine phosphatase family protein [Rhodomicrobium sp.]|nr:histidine phosphatase family protein [Rhodomicrobium sp.]
MPLIYFIRHGQTDWNAERRFQGQLDVPVNDTGRGQAARNGRTLAGIVADPAAFDFVSSPLRRAAETMEIIRREMALAPDAYRTDPRLMEIHVGDWQGRWTREIFGDAQHHDGGWDFVHPGEGGESYAMLSARVLAWLAEVKSDTVVTAHGGVMRCLRRHFLGLDQAEAFKLDAPQDKVLRIDSGALSWL